MSEIALNERKSEFKDCGLISVVMPTYKQKELLHKAVESVLNQTYRNIELIVIDDNTSDAFRTENKRFFAELNDPRVVYLQNEKNLGSTGSRNRAIFAARGDYITFLDDDDVYDAQKVAVQVEAMHTGMADVSVCNMILLNEDGKIVDQRKRRYLKRNEPLLTAHLKYHITGTDTMMFRAQFLKDIGGFGDQDLGDEFYLMFKALQQDPKFVYVDYDGVYAIVHSQTGLSSGDNKIKTEQILMAFKEQQFEKISKRDARYVKMRHHTVLAVAHKKNKHYVKCLGSLLKAFAYNGTGMLRILTGSDR